MLAVLRMYEIKNKQILVCVSTSVCTMLYGRVML